MTSRPDAQPPTGHDQLLGPVDSSTLDVSGMSSKENVPPSPQRPSAHAESSAAAVSSPSKLRLHPIDNSFGPAKADDEPSDMSRELDAKAEQEMHRQLLDFESSFLPIPSPPIEAQAMEDPSASQEWANQMGSPLHRIDAESGHRNSSLRPQRGMLTDVTARYEKSRTPSRSYMTPVPASVSSSLARRPPAGDTEAGNSSNLSSLETMSLPATGEAARILSRAVSATSAGGYETADDGVLERRVNRNLDDDAFPERYTHVQGSEESMSHLIETPRAVSENTPHLRAPSALAQDTSQTQRSLGVGLETTSTTGMRPSSSRQVSNQSVTSTSTFASMKSEDAASEATLGADYALQSGGAAPSHQSVMVQNHGLARTISLGSIASGISGIDISTPGWDKGRTYGSIGLAGSTAGPGDGGLGRLDEEKDSLDKQARPAEQSSHTRPSTSSDHTEATLQKQSAAVTTPVGGADAVLTVRKNTRVTSRRNRSNSAPRNSELQATTIGRAKGLTLKEQSSTIDRLQKENFDLKLKVHYLNKALNERSDEGIKEMISENVELKVGLELMEKQNRTLRRTVSELEQKLREREDGRVAQSRRSSASYGSSASSTIGQGTAAAEEEVTRLRIRVEQYQKEMEGMKATADHWENERRRLIDVIRVSGEKRRSPLENGPGDELDLWRDLYEAEAGRREQAEDTVRRLQDELSQLKLASPITMTNGHRQRPSDDSQERASSVVDMRASDFGRGFDRSSAYSGASSTLVEQLRQENEELRREVGAQASMLTSRNREKERLYQEIEDLKLGQMRGEGLRSSGGDGLFDRAGSRARPRSGSATSGLTRVTVGSDTERDTYERRYGRLRDELSQLRLQNRELEMKLEECLDEVEQVEVAKARREKELEEELDIVARDLQAVHGERDEVMMLRDELETEYENLKQEAQQEINNLEADLEHKAEEIRQLRRELSNRNESFNALQGEMRSLSEVVVRLEDDQRSSTRQILNLQQELHVAHTEIDVLDRNLREANAKVERYTVQQESSQGEIAFLREEQDADKMKIGDLETALKNARNSLQEESDRLRELQRRTDSERRQRDILTSRERQEHQKVVADLKRELSGCEDEIREIKKSLSAKESEAKEWKESAEELEENLREALGDPGATRASLLRSINKLQSDLEATVAELESAKSNLADRERILRHRDGLLESAGLESRKLSEMLEKERQARKTDRHHYEQLEKSTRQALRSATQQESRVLELETARQGDRKKLAALEAQYREQLLERNNLLLALWNRLSTLCGTEWQHKHSQVGGKLPSLEVVAAQLPGFSRNLLLAVKTIEALVGGFKLRVRNVEKELWKEYQTLEHGLDQRFKRLEKLEGTVGAMAAEWASASAAAAAATASSASQEARKHRHMPVSHKSDLSVTKRQDAAAAGHGAGAGAGPSSSSSSSLAAARSGGGGGGPPNGHRVASSSMGRPQQHQDVNQAALAAFTRHYSTSAIEALERLESANSSQASLAGPPGSSGGGGVGGGGGSGSGSSSAATAVDSSEQRWVHRLKELEKRLKMEREARLLDRSGARKRLEEGRAEYEELKMELERERTRKAS